MRRACDAAGSAPSALSRLRALRARPAAREAARRDAIAAGLAEVVVLGCRRQALAAGEACAGLAAKVEI